MLNLRVFDIQVCRCDEVNTGALSTVPRRKGEKGRGVRLCRWWNQRVDSTEFICVSVQRVQRMMDDEMGSLGGDEKKEKRFGAREQRNVTRPISATIDRPISNYQTQNIIILTSQ